MGVRKKKKEKEEGVRIKLEKKAYVTGHTAKVEMKSEKGYRQNPSKEQEGQQEEGKKILHGG